MPGVIRAASEGFILWVPPVRRRYQVKRSCRAFQQNIVIDLLNAVRIRRDNKDGVLQKTKLEFQI